MGGFSNPNLPPGSVPGSIFQASQWYPSGISSTNPATKVCPNGTADAFPFFVAPGVVHSFSQIGVSVSGAAGAGGVVALAVYADNGQGYPGALVASVTGLATTSAVVVTSTLAVTLGPGLYWVCAFYSGAASSPTMIRAANTWSAVQGWSQPGATGNGLGWSVTGAPATPPAAFPSGGTLTLPTIVSLLA